MDASDRIITQLIDTICLYKWASPRVRLFQWNIKLKKILDEMNDMYTENEIRIIKKRISDYPFRDFFFAPIERD
jgi:hypothetical protein